MSVEEISQLKPDFVSFLRGKKVALEKMEPRGLKGKRCVYYEFLSWRGSFKYYKTAEPI